MSGSQRFASGRGYLLVLMPVAALLTYVAVRPDAKVEPAAAIAAPVVHDSITEVSLRDRTAERSAFEFDRAARGQEAQSFLEKQGYVGFEVGPQVIDTLVDRTVARMEIPVRVIEQHSTETLSYVDDQGGAYQRYFIASLEAQIEALMAGDFVALADDRSGRRARDLLARQYPGLMTKVFFMAEGAVVCMWCPQTAERYFEAKAAKTSWSRRHRKVH